MGENGINEFETDVAGEPEEMVPEQSGLTPRTSLVILYGAFILMPANIYLLLVAGQSLITPIHFIALILWVAGFHRFRYLPVLLTDHRGRSMPGQPELAEIRERQARDIAERLWLASKLKVLSPRRAFNMNDAVDVALFLTDKVFRTAGVALTRKLDPDTPEVDAQMGQIEQALISVLLNACEAAGGGGEVTVTTGSPADGGQVEVLIEDTGEGIPPEALKRVFEPFFSTRGRLGMGLSTAREMVLGFGGDIRIESTVGKGTKVLMVLQVVRKP